MVRLTNPPRECVSNELFASSFPATLKRQSKRELRGTILGKSKSEGCYRVQWEGLKTPWSMHEHFFRVLNRRAQEKE